MERLIVLDTPALYYRAFYALPTSLTSPDNVPVNALRGVLDTIAELITQLGTQRLIAAFDADWRPAFRTTVVPEYKAQRERTDKPGTETPDELEPQIPLIRQACQLAGIPVAEVAGTEADDVIGSIVTQSSPETEMVIVSPDRDMLALLSHKRTVTIYQPRPKGQWEATRVADLATKYGVPDGHSYRELAALRGDPSDGLVGAHGIGEKTAAKLLAGFGSLQVLFNAAHAGVKEHGLTPKRAESLIEAQKRVNNNVDVMTVKTDLPVSEVMRAAERISVHYRELHEFGQRYGVTRSVDKLLASLNHKPTAEPLAPPATDSPVPSDDHAPSAFNDGTTTAPWAENVYGFDLETTGVDPAQAHIVTAAFVGVTGEHAGQVRDFLVYQEEDIPQNAVRVHGITTEYSRAHGTPLPEVLSHIIAALVGIRNRGGIIAGHNVAYDLTVLVNECRRLGLREDLHDVLPPVVDTLVLDKHIDRYRKGPRNLETVAQRWEVELIDAHEAATDARAAALVAVALAKNTELGDMSANELHEAQIVWKAQQAASFQEYLRRTRNSDTVISGDWPIENSSLVPFLAQ